MLLDLFVTFFIIGMVSFGGGYALFPVIQQEVVNRHGWMSVQEFTDLIAVAGIAPGPPAANIAILTGHHAGGIPGAVAAAIGISLPSLILVIPVGIVFFRIKDTLWMKSSMYGLRAIITGLGIYAAIVIGKNSGMMYPFSWFTLAKLLIFLGSLIALTRFRKHPALVIIGSGLIGVAIF